MLSRISNYASVMRWLGPWTKETAAPPGIARETWTIRAGELRGHRAHVLSVPRTNGTTQLDAYVYTPKSPVAMYVLSPGMHFAGPDDPRLDRFCRVLSNAGFVVVAPFLPSFVDLQVEPSAVTDLEEVLRAACKRFPELGRPTIFSISFGSWPALEVAARNPELVDGVITFGGYADFEAVMRFCIDGVMHLDGETIPMAVDPLNMAAVFLNVVPHLDPEGDRSALEQALREMCYRTWGHMELKQEGRLVPYVDALAPDVPEHHRAMFRDGAGGGRGARAHIERALGLQGHAFAYLDPTKALERLRCPVVVCHGRDDDVIPWGEAVKLHRALSHHVPTRLHLTGFYAHTGHGRPKAGTVLREARTLLEIAYAVANGGRLREAIT